MQFDKRVTNVCKEMEYIHQALEMAAILTGVGPGAEVIVPSYP